TNGVASATLHVSAGVLVNVAGGQIQALAGSGGAPTLDAPLDKPGAIPGRAHPTLNKNSPPPLNRGPDQVSGGGPNLFQSIPSPTFTNTGTIHIGSSRIFRILGGAIQNAEAGIIEGQGTLNVAAAAFSNAGSVNPGTSPGALTVAGDFPQTGTGKLN